MKTRSRSSRALAAVLLAYLLAAGGGVEAAAAQVESPEPPALILIIVVDQLRGEAPLRLADRFGGKQSRDFTHVDGSRYAMIVNADFSKSRYCQPEFRSVVQWIFFWGILCTIHLPDTLNEDPFFQ